MQRTVWATLIAGAVLYAQPGTATPLRLTMDEAVARATAANLDLGATRKDIDVARASLARSDAWLPSNPYLSAGAQRTSQSGFGPNYVFLLSQEFEVAGQRTPRMRAAAAGVEKATWDAKTAENGLAATVKNTFIQAQVHVDRVTLAQQSVDTAAQLVVELAQQNSSADAQRVDLNIARIQESRARRELAAAERVRDSVLNTLRRLLALPSDVQIELAGTPQTEVKDLPAAADLIERARRQRPDLAGLQHNLERADHQLALSQRERFPNITLSGTLSRFEGDTLTGGDIGLPIPIFNRKTGDIQEAVAERERAGLQAQQMGQLIEQEVVDARRVCVEAGADLQTLQREIVPNSEENLRLERRQYEHGTVTVSELVGVQIDLITARRDYLDALQAYNEALVDLERLTGGSL